MKKKDRDDEIKRKRMEFIKSCVFEHDFTKAHPFSFLPASLGDLYVFPAKNKHIGLQWLVTRVDNNLLLLVPLDDNLQIGTPDLKLPVEFSKLEMVVRCGEADYFPRSFLKPANRVGSIEKHFVSLVQKHLADLARGIFREETEEVEFDDLDPDYEEWMSFVAKERLYLQKQVQNIISKEQTSTHIISPWRLENNLPKELFYQPELLMAASDGSSFFEDDNNEKSVKQDGFLKHFEIDFSDGLLFLIFNDRGVEGRWKGTYGTAPKLCSNGLEQCDWVTGPEGKVQSTKRRIPWKEDGKIILEIKKNSDNHFMEFSR